MERVWRRGQLGAMPVAVEEPIYFSIVIVARNEEHLSACIHSILGGEYPQSHYEILLVDDHSDDCYLDAVRAIRADNFTLIRMQDECIPEGTIAYKKLGQEIAIQRARYDRIVWTDGDCICPPRWLHTLAQYDHYDVVTGPIVMVGDGTWLSKLQQWDIVGTMLSTYYGISRSLWLSANAANMSFGKQDYLLFCSQRGVEVQASGDDVHFIQWASQHKLKVGYVLNRQAIISTDTEHTWTSFVQQRLRWAAKTTSYSHRGLTYMVMMVACYNLLLIGGILVGIVLGSQAIIWAAVGAWVLKWSVEYELLSKASGFFGMRYALGAGLLLSMMHSLYIVIIGILSLLQKQYNWKGREVS